MPSKFTTESLSPVLHILQEQIFPWVSQHGMKNVIIAESSWSNFQRAQDPLPHGVYVTRQKLKSKKTPVKSYSRGRNKSLVNAVWPEDGLCSTIMPVLMFVISGQVALPMGDYVVHCQAGHAVLWPPGTARPDGSLLCTEEAILGHNASDMFSLMPWGDGVECWLNHSRNNKHWSHCNLGENCHVLSAKANFYLETLAEEAVTRAPHFRIHCAGLLLALVTLLMREVQELRAFQPLLYAQTSLDPDAPPHIPAQDSVVQAQVFINNHLQETLTIDRVANYVHMSRACFTRQFRQTTGKTFIEYVTECRLTKARVLLQDTNWPIEKISALVGVTTARLRSLFLQYEQQTPSDFRQQKRFLQKSIR